MKYRTSAAFRAALEARLKASQHDGVGFARLRKRVVFERLLARLHAVAPNTWMLKGGFALELRLGANARTTKDIDVDWAVGEDEAVELLLDAAAVTLDDRFEFAVERSLVDDDLPGGIEYFAVTAGHCVSGHLKNHWSTVNADNQTRYVIGEATQDVFGSNGDIGLIKETGFGYWESEYAMYVNIADQTATYPIDGVISSYPGLYECFAGAQSNIHSHLGCGTVQRTGLTMNGVGHQVEVFGLPQQSDQYGDTHVMCAFNGDSGGPFVSQYNIVGILSSSYEGCPPAHEDEDIVFYTDAGYLESYYGLAYDVQ